MFVLCSLFPLNSSLKCSVWVIIKCFVSVKVLSKSSLSFFYKTWSRKGEPTVSRITYNSFQGGLGIQIMFFFLKEGFPSVINSVDTQ